jgi:CO/xanthine dehydrogenase FAD-binding subunit
MSILNLNPSFIRKQHESDPSLIYSKYARCNAPIGAASSHAVVKRMEDKHACPVLERAAKKAQAAAR